MDARWAWLVVPLLAAGCGDNKTSVRGTVTYNGEPVKYGHILFQPAEGGGLPSGADVFEGEYQVRQLPPGKKRVLIKSKPSPRRVPQTSFEREHVELVAPKNPIQPAAVGNNQVVELLGGDHELDFSLTSAPAKKR